MASLPKGCSHCWTQGIALKHCGCCTHASYCSAACQKAAWKMHSRNCPNLKEVWERVQEAHLGGDWPGVLTWGGRIEDMMKHVSDDAERCRILQAFVSAHRFAMCSSEFNSNHAVSMIKIEERRIELLGKMGRFRDQGEAMCQCAYWLILVPSFPNFTQEAAKYFQLARGIGAENSFYSVECRACLGLGRVEIAEGRDEEGMELLRSALVHPQHQTLNPKP